LRFATTDFQNSTHPLVHKITAAALNGTVA